MTSRDDSLPPELAAANRLEFDYATGQGPDFYPFDRFMPAEEVRTWFRKWTGNVEVDGAEFRVFGEDGTGGYAAVWLARPGSLLLDQPMVFLGSEGQTGVVAADFSDYLCLLASGTGPYEAVANPDLPGLANADAAELALRRSPAGLKSRAAVLARAASEFPGFQGWVDSLCR